MSDGLLISPTHMAEQAIHCDGHFTSVGEKLINANYLCELRG
jgi:hypothetical protein